MDLRSEFSDDKHCTEHVALDANGKKLPFQAEEPVFFKTFVAYSPENDKKVTVFAI